MVKVLHKDSRKKKGYQVAGFRLQVLFSAEDIVIPAKAGISCLFIAFRRSFPGK